MPLEVSAAASLKDVCTAGYLSSLLTEFGLAQGIGQPRLSHGSMDFTHVHDYEQTFWHVDTIARLRSEGVKPTKSRDLWRLGKEPEVPHYERDSGLYKALNAVALLIPVQCGGPPQNLPPEGESQRGGPSAWSRRGRLTCAADARKAALQHLNNWQARVGMEETLALKPVM